MYVCPIAESEASRVNYFEYLGDTESVDEVIALVEGDPSGYVAFFRFPRCIADGDGLMLRLSESGREDYDPRIKFINIGLNNLDYSEILDLDSMLEEVLDNEGYKESYVELSR